MNILEYLESAGVHGRNHSLNFILAAYDITMQRRTPDCNEVIISASDIQKWIANRQPHFYCNLSIKKEEPMEIGLLIKCP